jgi:hypothetical protein
MTEHRPSYLAISTHIVTQPIGHTVVAEQSHTSPQDAPLARLLAKAQALITTAQFLYHIHVTYHSLGDGTYQVDPVGDNSFTTIASASSLNQAILDQITCFMESPAFIDAQVQRLTAI